MFLSRELRLIVSAQLTSRPYSSTAPKVLRVLGLESSADDSCAAIVTSNREILSNVVIRQDHEKYGGIQPLIAIGHHSRNMPEAISRALREARLTLNDLDGIAFTRGPGMYGCLAVCAGAAKALSAATGLPLMGVHHMQAHALTVLLTEDQPPSFPFLTLLVSGGHTMLVLARSESNFKVIATALDESIGMSFDKVARDLAIPWSLGAGSPGAALEAFAAFPSSPPFVPSKSLPFVVPIRNQLAFSFSGLRSSLMRIVDKESVAEMDPLRKRELVRGFMAAGIQQLEEKVGLALTEWEKERSPTESLGGLVVSGGVASNSFLRERLRAKLNSLGYQDLRLIVPPANLCTDNASMIAAVGLSRLRRNRLDPSHVMHQSKWSIEDCEQDFETPPPDP